MPDDAFLITPATNVAELLERYPELVEVLVGIAPNFKNLTNPVMRKTMARFATLQTAAETAKMPVEELVERLRAAVEGRTTE